ncbi:MAG: DUF3343 domain-containing protein [Victivallales bacterium]|nr:DUF3343 domain-containing protein [Victivallales bacterium]MCF7888510.1 DUF3343 domain-containing protein [Victivallales bacterium]
MEEKLYLIFETTRKVIIAEKLCIKKGYSCLAVPVPRIFSSKCGIALEIKKSEENEILTIFEEAGIKTTRYSKSSKDSNSTESNEKKGSK